MNEPVNEKPVIGDPIADYGIRDALIETNAAVQRLAETVNQAISLFAGYAKRHADGGDSGEHSNSVA